MGLNRAAPVCSCGHAVLGFLLFLSQLFKANTEICYGLSSPHNNPCIYTESIQHSVLLWDPPKSPCTGGQVRSDVLETLQTSMSREQSEPFLKPAQATAGSLHPCQDSSIQGRQSQHELGLLTLLAAAGRALDP